MAAITIFTAQGALQEALDIQTALAVSKLRLFKAGEVVLEDTTTLTELVAAECDYDGYTPTGETITAWLGPLVQPDGTAVIESGTVLFAYVDSTGHVHNTAGGWFLVDSGGALRRAGTFDPAVPLQQDDQGIFLNVPLTFGG